MSLSPADPQAEFDQLLDDFQRRLRAGEGPSAEEYADRYPHQGDRIRNVFPMVATLELVATPAPSSHPAKLGDYRIVREVGRGGMGVVYEAVQESLGRRVALKVFPAAHLHRPGLRERFEREAKAAGRLHHTHIVPVFGVGEDHGVPFFAMQFISGVGLDRVIAGVRAVRGVAESTPTTAADLTTPKLIAFARPTRPLPAVAGQTGPAYFRTTARLLFEAAEALAHAHSHGVQHRDIKPANLMVDDDGALWVTDFGLAKMDDGADLTASGEHLGTVRYVPPERFRGDADHRADIYSLGATFYELLAIRPAYEARDTLALIDRIKAGPPAAPRAVNPAVPRDLDTICMKCLATDPARRYQTAQALADDLRAFLDGRPIRGRRISPVEAAVTAARRRPVSATVAAGLVLSVVVAGGAAWVRERERQDDRANGRITTLRLAALPELPPILSDFRDDLTRARSQLADLARRPITTRAGLNARLALLGDDPRYIDEVVEHLLGCPAEQVLPVRQTAAPFLGPYRERFWQALLDPAADPAVRVRAAGVLAGQNADDPRWVHAARPLVDLLVNHDPVELGHLAQAVTPVLPRLTDALQARYERDQRELATANAAPADLAARVGRMNAAAVLLWQTLDERPDAVAWLAAVAEDAHLPAPMAAIRRKPDRYVQLLRSLMSRPGDDPEVARRRAGAAAALLATTQPDEIVWGQFRHGPDPTTRSHLIRRCLPAGVPAAVLATRFAAEQDITAKRGLLLALAEYPADRLPAGFLAAVADAYKSDPDPGLHAAAGWALRHRWGQAASLDAIDRKLPTAEPGVRKWFVTPDAGTFAVLPAPGRVQIGTTGATADSRLRDEVPVDRIVGRSFAIGFTEVPASLLRQWPMCPKGVGEGEMPAGRVTWFAAAAFCNWLSEKEGLKPCYEPAPGGKFSEGMRPVPFHVLRSGYRLPTEAEWEVAARAGATTPRFFGRADGLLTRYAWTVENSGDDPHPVGGLRPNDFGLFDVLGNVQEWADDRYSDPYPPGLRLDFGLVGAVQVADQHVLRGGAYNLPENRLRSAYRFNLIPGNHPTSCGFRLCRTIR